MYVELYLKLPQYQVKFIFIATFKKRKSKQRTTIQSSSQPHLYSISLTQYQLKIQLSSICPKYLYSESTNL